MSYLSVMNTIDLIRSSGISSYRDNAESRHRLIMSLFPRHLGDNPRENNKILFRFEKDNNASRFIVRSEISLPNLSFIKDINEDFSSLSNGQYLFYRTALNPVTRVRNKETFISDSGAQEDWFIEKVSPFLSEVSVIEIKEENLKRSKDKNMFIKLVQFDGIAKIEDADKLKEVLANGFGRSKAYGAGLLTVKSM